MAQIREGNDVLVLSHYPMMTWNDIGRGSYLLYGHIHNGTDAPYWPLLQKMDHALNAGVDVNGFRPVTLEELKRNNDAFRAAHAPQSRDPIDAYFALAAQRPELFAPSESVPLVMDEGRMRDFARTAEKSMGLVYDNRPYYMVLADLCGREGREFSYARVVYPQPGTNGAVAIPRRGETFGLLRLFRHAPRAEGLEFPRGFAEQGLSPEENIRKELREEMGAQVTAVTYLGSVQADTGLSAGCAQVFLAETAEAAAAVGHEGIRELLWLTKEELRQKISAGEITDGFTLSALTLLQSVQGSW
jgi:ADP-ribose pyrophosphatase